MTPEQFNAIQGKLDEILVELRIMNQRTMTTPLIGERWQMPAVPTCAGGTYPGMEKHEVHPPLPKVSK